MVCMFERLKPVLNIDFLDINFGSQNAFVTGKNQNRLLSLKDDHVTYSKFIIFQLFYSFYSDNGV